MMVIYFRCAVKYLKSNDNEHLYGFLSSGVVGGTPTYQYPHSRGLDIRL